MILQTSLNSASSIKARFVSDLIPICIQYKTNLQITSHTQLIHKKINPRSILAIWYFLRKNKAPLNTGRDRHSAYNYLQR